MTAAPVSVADKGFDVEFLEPFWLLWHDGRRRRHAPDFFVRLIDGTGVVVDVRADDRIEVRDAEAFAATERACTQVGWRFRRVGVLDPVFAANVRWLAGYRHPRCYRQAVAAQLLEVFSQPRGLFDGADAVGPRLGVLPVLYHLMWLRMLVTDLHSLRFIASACASMSAAVGLCRRKLRLLNPRMGVRPKPLSSARAAPAGPATTPTGRTSIAATRTRVNLVMRTSSLSNRT